MSDADVQQGITVDLVVQYRLDVHKILAVYVEMGGMCTEAHVLRYLAGSSPLPQLQRDLIAHAVNEQFTATHPRVGKVRAPYSSSSIATASGYPVSELDGDRLAAHRQTALGTVPVTRDTEAERVASVYASGLLDAPVSERLTRITRTHFNVMEAALNLIGEDKLFTKSSFGSMNTVMPRKGTFCNQTIYFDRTLVIPNTLKDPQFRDNPLVTGSPFIRFYAGHPIQGPGGFHIGALCIIDDSPRTFSTSDEHKLRTLAALVQQELWAPHLADSAANA